MINHMRRSLQVRVSNIKYRNIKPKSYCLINYLSCLIPSFFKNQDSSTSTPKERIQEKVKSDCHLRIAFPGAGFTVQPTQKSEYYAILIILNIVSSIRVWCQLLLFQVFTPFLLVLLLTSDYCPFLVLAFFSSFFILCYRLSLLPSLN